MTQEDRTDSHSLRSQIGRNVSRLRRLRNLSRRDLGARIGRSELAIAAIETGSGILRIDDLSVLAAALDVSPAELIDKEIEDDPAGE